MDVHGHCVQLLQAAHTLQQQNHQSASLDCLNRAREQVWCQGLEVLEDAHAVCVTENLLRLLVVNISDVLCRDEKFERVFGIDVANAALDFALDLLLALLPVTGEAKQLVLVQVDDDILLAVTNDDEEASFLFLRDCELGSNDQLSEAHELEHHSGSKPECGSHYRCVSIVRLCGVFFHLHSFLRHLDSSAGFPASYLLGPVSENRTPLNCVRLIAEVIQSCSGYFSFSDLQDCGVCAWWL
jgi:hypothetical protein